MGSRISVDKHVSRLEDVLELNTKVIENLKFQNTVPDCITQHIKIWKFSEDENVILQVRSDPINLSMIQNAGFNFLSNECYMVLLIYRKSHQDHNMFLSFPHQMWGVVESYSNLTPRGLSAPLVASDKEILESFLIPQRSEPTLSEFEYMIFVWNGRTANAMVKAHALSNAFDLENLLNKSRENLLHILFSGGVIRNKKLQKGNIMQFSSQAQTPINQDSDDQEQTQQVRETVYLFNFLFPDQSDQPRREFSKLSDFLKKNKNNETTSQTQKPSLYENKFKQMKCTQDSTNKPIKQIQRLYDQQDTKQSPNLQQLLNQQQEEQKQNYIYQEQKYEQQKQEQELLVTQGQQNIQTKFVQYEQIKTTKNLQKQSQVFDQVIQQYQESEQDSQDSELGSVYEQAQAIKSEQDIEESPAESIEDEQQQLSDSQTNLEQQQQQQQQQQYQLELNEQEQVHKFDLIQIADKNSGKQFEASLLNQVQVEEQSQLQWNDQFIQGQDENDIQFQTQVQVKAQAQEFDSESDDEQQQYESVIKYQEKEQEQFRKKVPSLNFKQLVSQQQDGNFSVRAPKFDLNLKNVISPLSSQRFQEVQQVDLGVSLIEGIEYCDIQKIDMQLDVNLQKSNAMRLQLNKIHLDQREEATYKDIEEEDRCGFNFDIRDTDRKKLKIQYFSEICSEVIKDFLYVGGESIAQNCDILKEIKVTHVINCAGDVCQNKFLNDFVYKTYFLKDSKTENIECLFYEVISFIDSVISQNGKVLVHCVQGVSRSVSFCIAYLIYKQKMTYSTAFDHIKKVRGVASPNMGFTVQLLLFQKRLQGIYDSIPVSPRVFAVGRSVTANYNDVVCRMLMDQMYAGKILRTFDSRGVFLIQSEHEFFIWIGPECIGESLQTYINQAYYYSNILKQNENAPNTEPILLQASEEPLNFWSLWGFQNNQKPSILHQRNKEWDGWYEIDIQQQIENVENFNPCKPQFAPDQIENRQGYLLFMYPNTDQSINIFDLEDLDQQNLCLLMKQSQDQQLQVFIWRGLSWVGNDDDERDYVDNIIQDHYRHFNHENIFIYKEEPNQESDEFLDCFQ